MSHANWVPLREAALELKIGSDALWRRLKTGQIPYIKDEFIDSMFVHKSVVDYLIDCYYKNRRFSKQQIKHMHKLHEQAMEKYQ